uniref:Proteasome subunit beta n=3 Tax=Myotis myotis TaxID=51298 RepID=A0A7J7T7L7_MYOMY|nr:proteasome 20S subunit beta 3 [Myotis myotis]
MSIMSYNGGAVMAMKGKDCVAIAADRRFGIQAQMVTTDFQKIFPMGDRLYIGLAGLATDVQTVAQRLKFRLNLYELKEGRQIKPYTLMSMVANLLYEKRFGPYYTEPVIAGLDPKTFQPFICSLDLIGCPMVTDDFVVSGTCAEQMYGMCESLWEPDMDPEHLFETISQAMLNAVDRDAVSGMGVVVHVMCPREQPAFPEDAGRPGAGTRISMGQSQEYAFSHGPAPDGWGGGMGRKATLLGRRDHFQKK